MECPATGAFRYEPTIKLWSRAYRALSNFLPSEFLLKCIRLSVLAWGMSSVFILYSPVGILSKVSSRLPIWLIEPCAVLDPPSFFFNVHWWLIKLVCFYASVGPDWCIRRAICMDSSCAECAIDAQTLLAIITSSRRGESLRVEHECVLACARVSVCVLLASQLTF